MKKWYFPTTAIIILLLVLAMYSGENKIQSNGEEQEDNIEIIFGVGIVNGRPKYLDPNYFEVPELIMSKDYLQKIDQDVINAGRLRFFAEPKLSVYDVKKDKPYSLLTHSRRELKYKVENQTLFVSDDGIEWEAVKFKVIKDQPYKDKDDPFVTIYWVVYLECRWFKGEYEIFSIPNA